jgi:hypothetical protein
MSNQFVFNQYYIDFVKRIKQASRKMKEDNNCDEDGEGNTVKECNAEDYSFAKKILKGIKANYITFDKSSDEYIKYINSLPETFWSSYIEAEEGKLDEWFDKEDVKGVELFTGINISMIKRVINDNFLIHHFLTVFYLFKDELTEDDVKKYIKMFQSSIEEDSINEITNEKHVGLIKRLNQLKTKNIKEKTNINMAGMEDTMLGKLAKEIMEDVDIDKLQKSIGENGDILKAIGDPDSGFGDLISNVSRKMATKISNGELKQEGLLQDAMKFASVMPGLFGAAGNGMGGSGSGGSSSKNQPDMSSMMKMMSAMMSNKEGMEAFSNMMNPKGKQKDTRATINKNALKKSVTVNRLKSKLEKRSKETE